MSKSRKQKSTKAPSVYELHDVDGLERMSRSEHETTEWLVPNVLPANCVNIIEGWKTAGKSTVLSAIVACYTGGPLVPNWTGPRNGGVVWLAREDPWTSVVRPRLEAGAANIERVFRVQLPGSGMRKRLPLLPQETDKILDMMLANGSKLLVIDPLSSICTSAEMLLGEAGCRQILDPLSDMCNEFKITVVITRHLKKSWRGAVLNAGYGHGALGNAARSIMRVDTHPNDPKTRLWSVVCCNWANPIGDTQGFRIASVGDAGFTQWTGTVPLTAQQIADGVGTEDIVSELKDAEIILVSRLQAGAVPYQDLWAECDKAGVTKSVMRRTGDRLGLTHRRAGGGPGSYIEWLPPEGGFPVDLIERVTSMGGAQKGDIYAKYRQNTVKTSEKIDDTDDKNGYMSSSATSPPPAQSKEGDNGSSH